MQGSTGYEQLHKGTSSPAPYEQRVYRMAAIAVVAITLAMAGMQGCRGRLEVTDKKFSSPSSEARSRLVLGPAPFSKGTMFSSAMVAGDLSPLSSVTEPMPGGPSFTRPGMFLIPTGLILIIRNCATAKRLLAGAVSRSGCHGRIVSGRDLGGDRRSDASAVKDDRPAANCEDVPLVCTGCLPLYTWYRLQMRDAGVAVK